MLILSVTEVPAGIVLALLPERTRLLNTYAPTVCAPAPLKFTVLVDGVNEPAVPLIKDPPTFSLPVLEKMIREAEPEEVIFPETLTVPVEIRIWLARVSSVVAESAIDAALKLPAPTLIWFILPPLACSWIVTAPVTVSDEVLEDRVMDARPVVPVVKLMELHEAE